MCQEAVYPVPPEPSLLNPHCKWSLPLPNCKKRNRVSPHTTVRCRRLVFICSLLPPTHPQLPLYPAGRLSAPVAVCCVSLGLLRSRGPHRIRWARELLGNLGEGRERFQTTAQAWRLRKQRGLEGVLGRKSWTAAEFQEGLSCADGVRELKPPSAGVLCLAEMSPA